MPDWNLEYVAEGFHEAAMDPNAWTKVLDRVGQQVGARGALLLSTDHKVPGAPFSTSLTPMLDEYFRDGWAEQDPRFRGVQIASQKGVVVDQDFLTSEEIETLPYYRHWLRSHDCLFFASMAVRSGSGFVFLTIQRSVGQGMFERHEVGALRSIMKPLSDSVALSRQFGQKYVLGMSDALQYASHAAMLLDEGARVLEMNTLCEAMLGRGFEVRQRRLHLRDQASRDAVDALVSRALSPLAPSGAAQGGAEIRNDVGSRFMVRAISLREWSRSTFTGASVMLVFERVAEAIPTGLASLARTFGLTPAEFRLATALREGLSTAEAAERLNIRYSTARTHLKAIMHKTDTHRQGQLMALLSKYVP